MANVTIQSNPGYIELAYSTVRGRSVLAALVRTVAEFFGRKGCAWGYSAFREKLAISKTTTWRNLSKIKEEDGFTVAMGEKSGWIQHTGELKKESYVRVEYWFLTETFTFVYKDKKTGEVIATSERRLTPCEVLVLALIYTHSRNKKKRQCDGTYKSMAGVLDMAEETVCRAVQELIAAGLIKQLVRGWSKKESVYCVNWQTFKPYTKAHAKKQKAETRAESSVTQPQATSNAQTLTPAPVPAWKKKIDDVNAKTDRERHYALLREQAQNRADRALERANSDMAFKNVETELSGLEIKVAKAELYKPEELGALLMKKQRLSREREVILSRLGISETDFLPKYRCSKCSDSGFKQDGRACDCYPKGGAT